ncbi:MAG: hypothetical protein B7733_07380 [Myxococcales bacterium FL481]|nr:MAG: hypothetical protein B7733_07380 [Myxococcales bacterium FL481]
MSHRVQHAIESIHREGGCPRLQVDATCDGVVCPDFLVDKWQNRLVIDLDPAWPLNLAFTDDGVEADLAFDGFVTRCTFPFHAIYVVANRNSGKGVTFEENIPQSLRRPPAAPPNPQARPKSSRRKRRSKAPAGAAETAAEPTRPQLGLATETGPGRDGGDDATPRTEAPQPKDEVAKRRSAFRVIDGGG